MKILQNFISIFGILAKHYLHPCHWLPLMHLELGLPYTPLFSEIIPKKPIC
jgi:hypothetical protein